ncbi:MAG: MFS transporter [Thermodesulfobacteriota bacterium]
MSTEYGDDKQMSTGTLFQLRRLDIRALHKTWFAFFLTFFVWFNMAPLATTIMKASHISTAQLKLLFICNVALTAPGRVIVGMLTDRFGPRKAFSIIMILLAIPCFAFAFSTSYTQMLISRLILSLVGTGFVVGIHMTSLWFKPRDIGFAQGVEAGLGNWGSSIAAMLMPVIALNLFGGENGWRYGIALSGGIMLAYGIFYWFSITDGPPGSKYHRPKRGAAIEVSTWADMINAMAWTVPTVGILAVLVWKIKRMGLMSTGAATVAYIIIGLVVLYQLIQIYRVNRPILNKGVPEDDKYRFWDVGCLCMSYIACFGAELGVVSMLPMFFQKTFTLTPQTAGFVGSFFAFTNFFARPLGGFISDRVPSRRWAHLITLAGITAGFILMGLVGSTSLIVAAIVVVLTALSVMSCEGTTFALVPLVKRRITGQVSGYVGSYGNVGAISFLTAYTFVSDSQFFFVIGGTALVTFLFCLFMLREPAGAFEKEYQLSSVDRAMMKED